MRTGAGRAFGGMFAPLFARLRARVDRALPNLRWRHAYERLPITLNQRRIYIVPSGFGLFFGVMMLAVLAGALNYNNNGALLFALLPSCLAAISMLQTFRNLDRLSLVQITADPVFAGEAVQLELHLLARDQRPRFGITLAMGGEQRHLDIAAGNTAVVHFPVPSGSRGWFNPPPVRVSTAWPFALFHAWSHLHSDVRILVYPSPESPPQPLPRSPDDSRRSTGSDPGEDDLRSLREYQTGDAMRLVAWKRSARTGELLVRQLDAPRAEQTEFDFDRLPALDVEARLRRLTRWVLEAEAQGIAYRLCLPGSRIGPDCGPAHRYRCLKALALHALPGP